MGTGKRRISTAARLEAKAEGGPVLVLELELELVLVQVELGHVPVQVELEHVPVAAELQRELVPVAAELERELVQVEVEAVPVPSQPLAQLVEQVRARLAVPLRTKSVIAVHHRGRVPLLAAVEDLAAGVETTRDPAATEAGIAWAAAGTVVAVVAPE